jgi:CheY-like chemotaxis protein
MVFARVLERRGYRVLTARNGAEGLAAWSKNPGVIDLVLTDIMMPRMSGVEMISAMRATDPNVPIIGLTGGLNDSDAASPLPALRKLGIETLLPKPIEVDELLRAIARKLPDAANPSPSP